MSDAASPAGADAASRPYVVPCRTLPAAAPFHWLRAGWHDLRRAPGLSLAYGVAIALLSATVSALAWWLGRFALLALLLSGFVFVAPLLAVGLYSVSRDLEAGRQPLLRRSFALAGRVVGQAGVFALLLLVILLVWSRAGMMLYALIPVPEGDYVALAELLAIGSAVGALFAALTFATAVFSLPMIADRGVDMITACVSSVHAVLRNKRAALVWGGLIVALTALGFATLLIGLAVIMPWLAYAAWHGYRATLDASSWPVLD
ncbi:MAG: DUF2189 domain-containing protein [Gammaproteobacteria bacterium]|nr:MAG: DUF2189 domain-containing protein [Gammaproteobacteria bacterium]